MIRRLDVVPGNPLAQRAGINGDPQQSRTYLERLALQIVGLQLLGYAGVHVSGVHTMDDLLSLEQAITEQGGMTSLTDWGER